MPPPDFGAADEESALPVRLLISTPDVKVDAAVEHVGSKTEGGKTVMDVPKKYENVAWFDKGYVPGERGNAVIAGHLDSETGKAVFWNLAKLRSNDVVSVVDAKGKTTRFKVRKVAVFYDESAPVFEIFGFADKAHLNLITCDGEFDRKTKKYDRRLIVFTDLVE
ncbi:MAG: class F sortase [Chloroflexia bacterium]